MVQQLKTSFAAALAVLLSACAGTDFVRPSAETFPLGRTTSAQVLQQMGQPRQTAEMLRNDKSIKSLSYAYAAAGGDSLEAGVTPARVQAYFFHNDTLVGREFISSFKSDHSNFDEKKIAGIAKGRTTRAEVIGLLGPATCAYLPPMVKETRGEAIGYAYQATSGNVLGGLKFHSKVLRITFDEKDAVAEVEYQSSGDKPN